MDNHQARKPSASPIRQGNGLLVWQRRFALLVFLVPFPAVAAGPVYFGLVGLILCILGYLLGLVITPFIIGTRKTASAKTTWGWIYFAYIMTPVCLIFIPLKYQELKNRMQRDEQQRQEWLKEQAINVQRERNIKVLSDHCNGQRSMVRERIIEPGGASVSIHLNKAFNSKRMH